MEEQVATAAQVAALRTEWEALRTNIQAVLAAQQAQEPRQGQGQVPSVRAPMPDVYKGHGEDFRYFITTVRSYCELTNIPNEKRVDFAVRCLGKGPAQVWESHKAKMARTGEGDPKDFDVFVTCLSKTYDAGDRATKARAKLEKIFQGGDSLDKYVERFLTLVAEVEAEGELSMADKLHKFKKGLKSDLQMSALLDTRTGKPFVELDDLIEYLTRLDGVLAGLTVQARGPAMNVLRANPPAKRGRTRGPSARVMYGGATRDPMSWPQPQGFAPQQHFTAAAMAPLAYGFPQRMIYPRADGLPPGQRVDRRTSIPMDRKCYVCGRYGCESWRHTNPNLSYRDVLVRPAPQNRPGMGRVENDHENSFYDRFALGRGVPNRRGGTRTGRGLGRGR
jgi:hypothetical protein